MRIDSNVAYLDSPSASPVSPPIETRLHEFPLDELAWEDLERLCLRLIETLGEVQHVQLYGVRGQDQEGIDIYARRTNRTDYMTCQVRRVRDVTPAGIRGAVDDFLAGAWADRSGEFIYATSASLDRTEVSEEIEAQALRLSAVGKTFTAWGRSKISTLLRERSRIADDFFGREWVRVTCGEDVAAALGRRLDLTAAREYRARLHAVLETTFERHDIASNLLPSRPPIDLAHRFIPPDLLWDVTPPAAQADGSDRLEDTRAEAHRGHATATPRSVAQRVGFAQWLTGVSKAVVRGGPGTGKSTLLRFLALESSAAAGSRLAPLGDRVPVWLPFAYWTGLVARPETSHLSLSEATRLWLESWGAADLWPLVERALEDDRAVLLVDGLDEWTEIDAGRIALDRLAVFVAHGDKQLVATARPAGLETLGPIPTDWTQATLVGLRREQQLQLVERALGPEDDGPTTGATARAFLAEIDLTVGLAEVARNPMQLIILLALYLRDAHLPANRFAAIGRICDYLAVDQPAQRRRAATVTAGRPPAPSSDETLRVLARLALEMLSNGDVSISYPDARQIIGDHLADPALGEGLSRDEADRAVERFLQIAQREQGLLAESAPGSVGFPHKSIQEHLAARHLARMPHADLVEWLRTTGTNPQWQETALTLLSLTNRASEVDELAMVLLEPTGGVESWRLAPLIAEIAVGPFRTSQAATHRLLDRAFAEIEEGAPPSVRHTVLDRLIRGAPGLFARDELHERTRTWLPSHRSRYGSVLAAFGKWPAEEATDSVLWRALFDEDADAAGAAGRALAELHRGDGSWAQRLRRALERPLPPQARWSALEALSVGWPEDRAVGRFASLALESDDPTLRLVAHRIRVRAGINDQAEFEAVLRLSDRFVDLAFGRDGDLAACLLEGWPRSEHLKEACLASLQPRRSPADEPDPYIESAIALFVLLAGFSGDPDVIEYCRNEIEHERYPFLGLNFDGWRLLQANFRDEPTLVRAIDLWIPNQTHNAPEIAFASMLGRTEVGKRKLLELLAHTSIPHWPVGALLEGWGIDDREVKDALEAFALGPGASLAAHHLPQILSDEHQAKARLFELLEDPDCRRPGFVVAGLGSLSLSTDERARVIDLGLSHVRPTWSILAPEIKEALYEHFGEDPRVRQLALDDIGKPDAPIGVMAHHLGQVDEIRAAIRALAAPASADVRERVVRAMGDAFGHAGSIVPLLSQFEAERDARVASEQAAALVRRMIADGVSADEVVNRARSLLKAGGPGLEVRRESAVAILLTAHRLDILEEEYKADPTRAGHPIGWSARENFVIGRLIADEWEYVVESLPEGFPSLLAESPLLVWDVVAPFARGKPAVAAAALSFVDSSGEISPNLLRLYAGERPGSDELFDLAIRALYGSQDGPNRSWGAAIDVLATQFHGDPRIPAHVGAQRTSPWLTDALLLSETQGDLATAQRVLDELQRTGPVWGDPGVVHRLRISALAPDEAAAQVGRVLTWHALKAPQFEPPTGTVVRRLQRDEAFQLALGTRLQQDTASPSEWCTLPRWLREAGALDRSTRDACAAALHQFVDGDRAHAVGYDGVARRRRPVSHSLIDSFSSEASEG